MFIAVNIYACVRCTYNARFQFLTNHRNFNITRLPSIPAMNRLVDPYLLVKQHALAVYTNLPHSWGILGGSQGGRISPSWMLPPQTAPSPYDPSRRQREVSPAVPPGPAQRCGLAWPTRSVWVWGGERAPHMMHPRSSGDLCVCVCVCVNKRSIDQCSGITTFTLATLYKNFATAEPHCSHSWVKKNDCNRGSCL